MPPPVGFYWDLENCQIPAYKSAFIFVQKLRSSFCQDSSEVEFVCVCDVTKERPELMHELNSAQISVMHVASISKNAADEKLKSYLRRFQQSFSKPATVVLISGDVGYASELSMLRYRSQIDVVLVHNKAVSAALLSIATRSVPFKQLLDEVPDRVLSSSMDSRQIVQHLRVSNLPSYIDIYRIRGRLHQLSDNCGGRVIRVHQISNSAVLRFPTPEAAARALRRMDNEDVFGRRITARLARDRPFPNGGPRFRKKTWVPSCPPPWAGPRRWSSREEEQPALACAEAVWWNKRRNSSSPNDSDTEDDEGEVEDLEEYVEEEEMEETEWEFQGGSPEPSVPPLVQVEQKQPPKEKPLCLLPPSHFTLLKPPKDDEEDSGMGTSGSEERPETDSPRRRLLGANRGRLTTSRLAIRFPRPD